MNFNLYIHGTPDGRYNQYPYDYTAPMLEEWQKGDNGTQMVIYRKMDLVYYDFVEKLNDKGDKIGLCIVFNNAQLLRPKLLIDFFNDIVDNYLIKSGEIIRYGGDGKIHYNIHKFNEAIKSYQRIISIINSELETNEVKYGIVPLTSSYNGYNTYDCIDYKSSDEQIVALTNKHNKVLVKDSYSAENSYFNQLISNLRTENISAKNKIKELESEIDKVNRQKKQYKWVAILGIIVVIFGVVLWNKVLFPAEVTRYEAGEFVYYGPIKDKKPHGVGVAIYHEDDEYGRKFYIGNFDDGIRNDNEAMLLYRSGDYFYGKMKNDKFDSGLFYKRSDGTYFDGLFENDQPYNGTWYDHKKAYELNY